MFLNARLSVTLRFSNIKTIACTITIITFARYFVDDSGGSTGCVPAVGAVPIYLERAPTIAGPLAQVLVDDVCHQFASKVAK